MNFPHLSRQRAAQAWCKLTTKDKVMDVELCEAFAEVLDEAMSEPSLGCATTQQLLNEIAARVDLNYSTVFYQAITQLPTPEDNEGERRKGTVHPATGGQP